MQVVNCAAWHGQQRRKDVARRDSMAASTPKIPMKMGENGVLWVSSAVNFPVVCSCLRVALACTPKLERHHAERALRRSRDLLGQEPTSPSLRAPNDMGKSAPKRASDADQDERPAEAKAGSGQEPPPSGAGGGTDGAPAAPPAPVDSAEELRVLRKRLEQLEAQERAALPRSPVKVHGADYSDL